MAKDSVLVNGVFTTAPDTLEIIYVASVDTLIKAVTASNTTEINAAYTFNIVPADANITKPEIPYRIVVRLASDTAAEVINHVIPNGGTLRVSTTAANSIAFRVTGRVLSDD